MCRTECDSLQAGHPADHNVWERLSSTWTTGLGLLDLTATVPLVHCRLAMAVTVLGAGHAGINVQLYKQLHGGCSYSLRAKKACMDSHWVQVAGRSMLDRVGVKPCQDGLPCATAPGRYQQHTSQSKNCGIDHTGMLHARMHVL